MAMAMVVTNVTLNTLTVVGHLNVKAVYVQVSRDRLIPDHSNNTNSVENIFHMEPAPMRDVLNVTETF